MHNYVHMKHKCEGPKTISNIITWSDKLLIIYSFSEENKVRLTSFVSLYVIKTLLASIRQDERDERAAVCSSGQSQVSRIDWRPQSRSRGRWLRPPRARASARSPSEAAAREPSSSSSSCSGVDGGRHKERLLSGSDQWRKNQLENQQIKKKTNQ